MKRSILSALEGRVLNIAHRGARSLAPENTIAAARKALAVGADAWELDVGVSADGELVVIHDSSLTRTSNVRKVFPGRASRRVRDYTLEELRQLDFGSWFHLDDPFGTIESGMVSAEDTLAYSGEKIPTLRDALLFTRQSGWLVNVEIKNLGRTPGWRNAIENVLAVIEEMEMGDRVLISSFNHKYLVQVRNLNPDIPTGALVEAPHPNPVRLLRRLDAQTYHPANAVFRVRDVAALHAAGYRVLVWVANDKEMMRTLVDAGVDGVFTDFPHLLKDVVDSLTDEVET